MGVSAGGDRPGRKAHHDLAVVDAAATLQGQRWRRPRGKPAYVVVQVETSLNLRPRQPAVDSHVRAWEAAERIKRSVRRPELAPATASRHHAGEDRSALQVLAAVQKETSTTSSTPMARLATPPSPGLSLAPVDTTGTVGPPCYWVNANGMRPARQ